jgi:hypothetical protein
VCCLCDFFLSWLCAEFLVFHERSLRLATKQPYQTRQKQQKTNSNRWFSVCFLRCNFNICVWKNSI